MIARVASSRWMARSRSQGEGDTLENAIIGTFGALTSHSCCWTGSYLHEVLDRAHHVVPHRAQIAAVVELEELGAEGRDVDLDWALPDARFARQAAVQGL